MLLVSLFIILVIVIVILIIIIVLYYYFCHIVTQCTGQFSNYYLLHASRIIIDVGDVEQAD